MDSLLTQEQTQRYREVLDVLDRANAWPRPWAEHQYVGLVISAMCNAVVKDANEARRYAVLRVMETFMEHRHDLLPATHSDFIEPRSRVAKLALAEYERECEPWIDILEYMQLQNWQRKGTSVDRSRIACLREQISDNFSPALADEIDEGTESWWAPPELDK
jgi:hypothetical protein